MSSYVGAAALPVPVTTVAGFLGAGKTTLMNHILTSDHGRRVALIVNDFGSVNIDAELVTDIGDGMVSLANGCICCAIRSDLIGAVLKLVALPERPDQVLIESSGVADPASVFRTFLQPEVRTQILVDGVLTVVDADQCLELEECEAALARHQIAGGDLVVLNKTDLVGAERLARVEAWIAAMNPRAEILRTVHCRLPVEVTLGAMLPAALALCLGGSQPIPDAPDACKHAHDHPAAFESWSYRSDRPLRLSRLQQVLSKLPSTLFRAKGFVFAEEYAATRLLLQLVGRRAVMSADRPWSTAPRETRLVFIARRGTCNSAAINAALDRCRAEDGQGG